MIMIQKKSEPCFKTVLYKGVELFVHRDTTTKPPKLRLYDAISGWVIAAGMTKAEARYQGITNPIEGKNEEELIKILENKLTIHDLKGESFKDLITRRRGENPPKEEQKVILKAYVEATAASRKAELKSGWEQTKAPVKTKVILTGDHQPRKKETKMPVEIQQRPRCNLILHCGAQAADRMEVARVSTPRPTETWTPIPHIALLNSVESSLRAVNLRIGNESHALSADGDQYFGLIELLGSEERDYNLVVGIRNSHNKTLPIGLVAGTSVFVCDNLSFNGSVRLMRRHTSNAQKDLPFLVSSGVGKLMQLWNQNDQRIAAYKECRIKDKTMHDLAISPNCIRTT